MPETDELAREEGTTPRLTVARPADAPPARPGRRRIVAALVVLALLGGGALWWTQRGLPGDVAVRVGDEQVSVRQLKARMATVEALYGVAAPEGGSARRAFWRDAAQSVAVGIVLEDAARGRGIDITSGDVDQALAQVVRSFYGEGSGGQDAFAQALASAGTSEKSVRDELARQLEINALFARVTGKVPSPTDGAVEAAYTERRCTLVVPEQRSVRNIVVATEREAADVLARLQGGASFAKVAAAVSIDASTKDAGGELGAVRADQLEKGYAAAAFAVPAGGLFGPVRGEFGWNVGRVDAVTPGRLPALAEIRDDLRRTLFSEAQSEVWRGWLRTRLKKAGAEYADRYRPRDPFALPDATVGAPGSPAGAASAPADPAC